MTAAKLLVSLALRCKLAADNPVVLRDEGLALLLLGDNQRQCRRLDATSAAHIADAAVLDGGEVAREHRTPDEVDVLARLAGVRKVEVQLDEVFRGERLLNLLLDEGAVASACDGGVGVLAAHDAERVEADELAFAVEVGCDDDGARLLGEVFEGADDALLLGALEKGCVGQIRERLDLPALEVDALCGEGLALLLPGRGRQGLGDRRRVEDFPVNGEADPAVALAPHELHRELDLEDVAAQTDGDAVVAVALEAVDRGVVDLVGLDGALRQKLGDVARRVVFLSNDQFHRKTSLPVVFVPAGVSRVI